ncbi:hypothetical protein [Arthrobacter cavernae]|nr:hypothetical protein [Arthrobacter cavernae]
MAGIIRAQEARGELVAGNLRSLAEKLGETVTRLRSETTPDPVGIKGVTARDAPKRRLDRPRSRSLKDIEAWAASWRDKDDDDDE